MLDAVLRIEHPKDWIKQQRGESRTYISRRRKDSRRRKSPRRK